MKFKLNNGKSADSLSQVVAMLDDNELCGQLLCFDIYDHDDPQEVEKIVSVMKPGGIFVSDMCADKVKMYTEMVNRHTTIPVIVTADIENGPEGGVKGTGKLPYPMAWGACADEELVREAGRLTARISRRCGVHWTFAPVIDLNYNFRSPETNIRAVSDSADAVIKYAGAYSDGLRSEGLMLTGAKHFPGNGTDERNSHFCTTVNPLGREEWMATYGKIYKEMFRRGTDSVMVGHSCLPAFMPQEEQGLPGVLSKSLMTDLLKGELGFKGCVISDAMSMIGACGVVDGEKNLAVEFLKAGGDVVLFPEDDDAQNIRQAVEKGEISKERMNDALGRILALKQKVGLFGGEEPQIEDCSDEFFAVAQKIADKSITVVRDEKKIIPTLKKSDKLLVITLSEPYWHKEATIEPYLPLIRTVEDFGCTVDYLINPKHKAIKRVMDGYDALLVLCDMSSTNYNGGSMRVSWYNIMAFWRGYVLEHPKMIFASLGDPYKLFDFPYLREYVNVYSNVAQSQIALAKVLTGQIVAQGKNPVAFEGFFEREI